MTLLLANPFVTDDIGKYIKAGASVQPGRTRTRYIVIHHAAAFYPNGQACLRIFKAHCDRPDFGNYNRIGYHEVIQIEADGVHIGSHLVNPPEMQGAGVALRNHECYHICAASNFTAIPDDGFIEALAQRAAAAKQKYPDAQIVGHKEIALPGHGTECPGELWLNWKPRLLKRVDALLALTLGPSPDNPLPYRFRFPQVVFTAPDPIAPLAAGPVNGATLYERGTTVQIGEIKNGWAWIKTGPGRLDGPDFVPLSVLEPA